MSLGRRQIPNWLRPYWEKKKQETASHVIAAVAKLTSEGRPVTFSSIREAVRILYGMPLSTNTIRRNELAYQVYRQHHTPLKTGTGRSPSLISLYQESDRERRSVLYAKVARLRRESKDSLITRLIQTEARINQQAHIENKLREEVMRLSVKVQAFEKADRQSAGN